MRHQAATLRITPRAFTDAVAPARTFGFLHEVETLRRHGLALGGSLENAIVIGESGVLNSKLRFEDEFVRHKILDAVGDLALLGHPLVGPARGLEGGPCAARRGGPEAPGHGRRLGPRRGSRRTSRLEPAAEPLPQLGPAEA